jgi:hypothetical protein
VGFEPAIPAFERAKTVHAFDRATAVSKCHIVVLVRKREQAREEEEEEEEEERTTTTTTKGRGLCSMALIDPFRFRVTLRQAIYRQSVRLDDKPLDIHDQ